MSEQFGFTAKVQTQKAPMPDYSLKFLPEGSVAKSLAGIAGIGIIIGIFYSVAYTFKKLGNSST